LPKRAALRNGGHTSLFRANFARLESGGFPIPYQGARLPALIRFLERAMPKPYSVDLRARVIEEVETGASRREAAERYGISPSVVVIWVQRFEETGSVAAKPSGGSTSPLEQHAEFLLGLIANQPELTLDEIVAAMRKRRIAGSRSAVWRFFARGNISFKKNSVCGGAEACGRSPRSPAVDARARHV
jgi:transposase